MPSTVREIFSPSFTNPGCSVAILCVGTCVSVICKISCGHKSVFSDPLSLKKRSRMHLQRMDSQSRLLSSSRKYWSAITLSVVAEQSVKAIHVCSVIFHVVYFLERNNYLMAWLAVQSFTITALQCTLYTFTYLLGFVEIDVPPCSGFLATGLKKFQTL